MRWCTAAAPLTDQATLNPPADEPVFGVVICYDGWWWYNVARYVRHSRGAQISFAGLHDVIRWHIACLCGHPVERVAVSEAHYVAGSCQPLPWAQELASLGVARHDVPVTASRKGGIGAAVELALSCYEAASSRGAYAVVLLSGDVDLVPLAARIKALGVRLVVPVTSYSFQSGTGVLRFRTSMLLVRYATSAPSLAELIGRAESPDYPADLRRPLTISAYRDGAVDDLLLL